MFEVALKKYLKDHKEDAQIISEIFQKVYDQSEKKMYKDFVLSFYKFTEKFFN